MQYCFLLGKDPRLDRLETLLTLDGYTVARELCPIKEPCAVLFPFRTRREEVLPLLEELAPDSVVLFGKRDPSLEKACLDRRLSPLFLLERKDYLKRNARETAEGVLAEILCATDTVLDEVALLICGYGNCGKAIGELLWLCGCEVWILSHQGSLARAEKDGFNVLSDGARLSSFDLVVNTAPSGIFTDSFLDRLTPGTQILQVAGGTDGREPDDFARRGLVFRALPGLPGRYSPQTDAHYLHHILTEVFPRKRE